MISVAGKHEAVPLRIVGDAAIASSVIGDGRLIPLLILETSERPDLEELIRVHQHLPPGDVNSQWGHVEGSEGTVHLLLAFKKPMEIVVIVEFDILRHASLVDQVLLAKACYLQAGREGDRLIHNPDAAKIIMEIPDTGFQEAWDEMYFKSTVKRMRADGLSRAEAKQAAKLYIDQWRTFGRMRMGAV
ncbi:MAG: hypothetical protein AB7E55_13725 [Pigmentiphaga sp.]